MVEHSIRVVKRKIAISHPNIIANGIKSDSISLKLDEEWADREVYIVLGSGYDALVSKWEGKNIDFPPALMQTPGKKIPISIIGYLGEGDEQSRIITAESDRMFTIVASGELPSSLEVLA